MVTREIHRSGDTYYGTGVSPSLNFATVFKDIHALLQSYDVIRLLSGLYYVQSTPYNSLGEMTVTKDYITVDADPDVTFQRSSAKGDGTDYAMLNLGGAHNKALYINFDDNLGGYASGAVVVGGLDNELALCTLDRCQRYGIIASRARDFHIRKNTIKWCQHGISGSSGAIGDWGEQSIGGFIEENTIYGMIIDAIKLKQMDGVTIQNNNIDLYPFHKGYIGGTDVYSKDGIYFAGTDTATKNATVRWNTIRKSTPYTGTDLNAYGFVINPDQTTKPLVFSENNKIYENSVIDLSKTGDVGILNRGKNYQITNNLQRNVNREYLEIQYGSYPPPSGNLYTPSTAKALTLKSAFTIDWNVANIQHPNGVYPATGQTTLSVPKEIQT